MKAFLNLRYTDDRRAKIFAEGLSLCGYTIEYGLPIDLGKVALFVTWNRIGAANQIASKLESEGVPVLVVENASWGNSFAGEKWYHMARNLHNTKSMFDYFGPERFNELNIELQEWRTSGETVILPQRGIGSPPVVMPRNFLKRAAKYGPARTRNHPGRRQATPLEEDLSSAGRVITWGSGAAIKALILGIPVIALYADWIGSQDNTDYGRREMFQRLAWAQWTFEDIRSGFAFKTLLQS